MKGILEPTPDSRISEKQARDWGNFLHYLSSAIQMVGGVGDNAHMKLLTQSSLKDVYNHLWPNRIKFVLVDHDGKPFDKKLFG